MLTLVSSIIDLQNKMLILTFNTTLPQLFLIGEGLTTSFDNAQGVIVVNISLTVYDEKTVILRENATGKDRLSLKVKSQQSTTTAINNLPNYVADLKVTNLIRNIEAYTLGSINVFKDDSYDRGLNDGLILGQMI